MLEERVILVTRPRSLASKALVPKGRQLQYIYFEEGKRRVILAAVYEGEPSLAGVGRGDDRPFATVS